MLARLHSRMAIEWDASLATGHKVLDTQHHELFRRVNGLVEAVAAGRGGDVVLDTLVYLVEYTRQHFAAEEREMRAAGYPELETHRRAHARFFEAVAALQDDVEQTGTPPSLVETVDRMVVEWLVEHVKKLDRQYAEWLRRDQP